MYCGSRRMAAMISAQVSSAAATGEPVPSATAMPRRVQVSMSMCDPTRPVCDDQLQPGQLLEQGAWKVGAFADQHQHFGIPQAHRQLADALDGVGEDLGVVGLQACGAVQLAHGVLVVVEDDDVHGGPTIVPPPAGRPGRA
jgi:hypothetical protein